jgi:hypothetical protein
LITGAVIHQISASHLTDIPLSLLPKTSSSTSPSSCRQTTRATPQQTKKPLGLFRRFPFLLPPIPWPLRRLARPMTRPIYCPPNLSSLCSKPVYIAAHRYRPVDLRPISRHTAMLGSLVPQIPSLAATPSSRTARAVGATERSRVSTSRQDLFRSRHISAVAANSSSVGIGSRSTGKNAPLCSIPARYTIASAKPCFQARLHSKSTTIRSTRRDRADQEKGGDSQTAQHNPVASRPGSQQQTSETWRMPSMTDPHWKRPQDTFDDLNHQTRGRNGV